MIVLETRLPCTNDVMQLSFVTVSIVERVERYYLYSQGAPSVN